MSAELFSIGSVVVPAVDGVLKDLGFEVATLGERGLGLVFEKRGQKALVVFPLLKINLWLGCDEIADVRARAAAGDKTFERLLPRNFADSELSVPAVFWPQRLSETLPVVKILGLESGSLEELWDTQSANLEEFYEGLPSQQVAVLSLGISEFKLNEWHKVEKLLGPRLLFARFLPAGLSKIEVILYLKA